MNIVIIRASGFVKHEAGVAMSACTCTLTRRSQMWRRSNWALYNVTHPSTLHFTLYKLFTHPSTCRAPIITTISIMTIMAKLTSDKLWWLDVVVVCDWWPFEWQGGVTRNLVAYSRERRIGDMVTKMSHGVPPRSDKGVSQPTVPRGVMSKIGTWWPGVPDVRLWCPWRLVTGWRRPLDIWWLVASPTVPAADVRPAPDKAGAGGEASMNNISRTFALPPLHNFPALSKRNL